jgi:uncharacterized protein
MRALALAGLYGVLAPTVGHYTDVIAPKADPPPQIVVTAHAEVRISPDRANIHISVQTRAGTAAAAATENATKQQAVISAIRALGIPGEQISTTNYSVTPEYRYDQGGPPVLSGYSVTNTVLVEVRNLAQVPTVIDASLAKGANLISGLEFFATNVETARREAIAAAVTKARGDAEAAAKAARGSLGGLLEISIGAYSPPPRPMYTIAQKAADAVETPISPGQQTLSVDVTTRWLFVAAQ